MKRIFGIILTLALIFTCTASAETALDYAVLSDEQLHEIIDAARNELAKRELTMAEDTVLFEQDGVTVYLTGNYEVWGYDNSYLDIEAVVVNDSDKLVSILIDIASINGWDVYSSGIPETSAGKKQKGILEFLLTDAEISTYEEVEEIEVNFTLYDSENWEIISTIEGIVIHCN